MPALWTLYMSTALLPILTKLSLWCVLLSPMPGPMLAAWNEGTQKHTKPPEIQLPQRPSKMHASRLA